MTAWEPGFQDVLGEVFFRVREGRKQSRVPGKKDLILEWLTPGGWRAVPMEAGALMADFFHHNENTLYPPGHRSYGGELYFKYLRGAVEFGYENAQQGLEDQQRAKQHREAAAS